jgi:BirA family biotin operon repressor/biotin-[acetyl-CoA-carboxylase] ligase
VSKKRLTPVARKLRGASTDAEALLWSQLRGRRLAGRKFVRQFPIGDAVADFACRSARLVVELDGGQHSDSMADPARTKLIEAHGYKVIRFWNSDVFENMDGVLTEIDEAMKLAGGE